MTWLTLLRDGSNLSGDMLARIVGSGGGSLGNIYDAPTAPGIGTGYTVGVVGKMNGAAGADPNHFAVIANGTNLTLTIRPGWAWVRRDSGSSSLDPRCLFVENNATSSVTLASNSQGSTRVDTIALKIDMSSAPDATGSNLPSIVIIQGGASSAVGNAPADGNLYVPLALVTVANGAPSVSNTNVADRRYVHPSQATFRAYANAAQTLVGAADNTVNLAATDYDPSGMFSATGHQWSVPLPGKYRFSGNAKIVPTTAGRFYARLGGTAAVFGNDHFTNGNFSGAQLAGEQAFAYAATMALIAFPPANVALQEDGPGQSCFLSASWVCF